MPLARIILSMRFMIVFSSRHASKPIYPTPVVNPRTPAVTARSNKAVYVTKAI